MSEHETGIEWTHVRGYRGVTWNPLAAFDKETGQRGWFCHHVSPGCMNCYAEKLNTSGRFNLGTGHEYTHQNRKHIEFRLVNLDKPLRWQKPRCVFVNSMTDLFHEDVTEEMIDAVFTVMANAPDHIFIVLTKRAGRMRQYLTDRFATQREITPERVPECGWTGAVLRNVWLGVSAEDQPRANDRVAHLLDTPASVRFVSYEPALGPVDFRQIMAAMPGGGRSMWDALDGDGALDWIVAGGESGTDARPPHPNWFRDVRDECRVADVPFFFKQWGAHRPDRSHGADKITATAPPTADRRTVVWPDGTTGQGMKHENGGCGQIMERVGKHRAGRTLDGETHSAFPPHRIPDLTVPDNA